MSGKHLAAALVLAGGLLIGTGSARAGDTVRLDLKGNTTTQNLIEEGSGADVVAVGHHGFGGYHGGYHGGYGGYRSYYGGHHGYYGGYRGFANYGGYRGYYRPYYGGYGYSRGYYGGGYYGGGFLPGLAVGSVLGRLSARPYYGGYYGSSYGGYYAPSYGYYSPYSYGSYYYSAPAYYSYSAPYWGCSLGTSVLTSPAIISQSTQPLMPPATSTLPPTSGTQILPSATPDLPETAPEAVPADQGTFPYDGGPRTPAPAPQTEEAVPASPSRTTPAAPPGSRLVSLTEVPSHWVYPAYGEKAHRLPVIENRTMLTRGEPTRLQAR